MTATNFIDANQQKRIFCYSPSLSPIIIVIGDNFKIIITNFIDANQQKRIFCYSPSLSPIIIVIGDNFKIIIGYQR
jgi:hypothetical protein